MESDYLSPGHKELRAEVVRLNTDLADIAGEQKVPPEMAATIEALYQKVLENCVGFAQGCRMGDMLSAYAFVKDMEKTIQDSVPLDDRSRLGDRFGKIDKVLKRAMTEIANENCGGSLIWEES